MSRLATIGLLLLALGAIALAIPTFTYFATERTADTNFFKIDVSRPHTVVINPLVGAGLLIAGSLFTILGQRVRGARRRE
jgi:hypothetical protein